MSHEKKGEWLSAMQDEMKSLCKNHTYDLVKLSKSKIALKMLQLEKIHTGENSSDMMTKALLKEKLVVCREIADMGEPSSTRSGGGDY